jgi:hypothetical protein
MQKTHFHIAPFFLACWVLLSSVGLPLHHRDCLQTQKDCEISAFLPIQPCEKEAQSLTQDEPTCCQKHKADAQHSHSEKTEDKKSCCSVDSDWYKASFENFSDKTFKIPFATVLLYAFQFIQIQNPILEIATLTHLYTDSSPPLTGKQICLLTQRFRL